MTGRNKQQPHMILGVRLLIQPSDSLIDSFGEWRDEQFLQLMLSTERRCRRPGKRRQPAAERNLMVPAINWACQSADCRHRMSAVSQSVEPQRPQLKTLTKFDRTCIQ